MLVNYKDIPYAKNLVRGNNTKTAISAFCLLALLGSACFFAYQTVNHYESWGGFRDFKNLEIVWLSATTVTVCLSFVLALLLRQKEKEHELHPKALSEDEIETLNQEQITFDAAYTILFDLCYEERVGNLGPLVRDGKITKERAQLLQNPLFDKYHQLQRGQWVNLRKHGNTPQFTKNFKKLRLNF